MVFKKVEKEFLSFLFPSRLLARAAQHQLHLFRRGLVPLFSRLAQPSPSTTLRTVSLPPCVTAPDMTVAAASDSAAATHRLAVPPKALWP